MGVSKFTFPKGQANILLNLGEGLTNETGATVRYVSDTELEGSKLFVLLYQQSGRISDFLRDASE
ncbi:hypothetical protein [Sphingobacterium sp. E70]|uniref:hypothetical protein n=1 Tax=Sphingobacterium sp. E70 TaxID=2853439 RepID=UPI00359C9FED